MDLETLETKTTERETGRKASKIFFFGAFLPETDVSPERISEIPIVPLQISKPTLTFAVP